MRFQVKDFMTRDVKFVRPGMNAKEALKLLLSQGTSGLPVIDEDGKPVGVFTEKEILKAVIPGYVQDVGAFIYTEDSKSALKKIAGLEKITVKEIMRAEISTISEESSVSEASRIMLTRSERRIIVLKEGRTVGVITRCDVVKAMAKAAGVEL